MDLPRPPALFAERYRLESVLGEGGFSTVYRATDTASSRAVAIKMLKRPDSGYTPEVESRFEREVRVIAQLRDPHTVTMYDFGRSPDGVLYMVFELVPGEDLSELLKRRDRLAPTTVIHIVRQVLSALGEAHSLGLLHRDIKPENIRVFEWRGDPFRAKVLDFGIARPAEQARATVITQEGELVGTPRYMSPEQLTEEELGPASDLYSLGLVAFEMLMGREALQGHRWADQFDRLVTGHVFAIQEYDRVGPGLRTIVLRMTERDPRDRYQSAESVRWALDTLTAQDSSDGSRPRPRPPTPTVAGWTSPPTREERRPAGMTRSDQLRSVAEGGEGWRMVGIFALVAALLAVGVFAVVQLTSQDEVAPAARKAHDQARVSGVVKGAGGEDASSNTTPDVSRNEAGPSRPATAAQDREDGCGKEPPFLGYGKLTHFSEIAQGRWDVHVPASYDAVDLHPVVFLFHQDARTGQSILAQSEFGALADEKGFIVVAPTYPGKDMWVWREASDVRYVEEVLDAVAQELCIDRERVFAVGHGAGGHIVERLACQPWIAAVATNGFRSPELQMRCPDAPPVPSLYMTPMDSLRIPPEGGTKCMVLLDPISLEATEKKWRDHNGCGTRRSAQVQHANGTCWSFEGCDKKFVSCHIDGGYGWPGNPAVTEHDPMGSCGDVIVDFPATKTIWSFFESVSG